MSADTKTCQREKWLEMIGLQSKVVEFSKSDQPFGLHTGGAPNGNEKCNVASRTVIIIGALCHVVMKRKARKKYAGGKEQEYYTSRLQSLP